MASEPEDGVFNTQPSSSEDDRIGDALEETYEALEDGFLPQWVYNDDTIYEAELDRIFAESWVFVGHETEIPEPGDYRLRSIGEDQFIFVRDESDEIHVLFNSCRHRGTQVCDAEQGNAANFRCPYHGWTFKNSGDLIGVPQREKAFGGLDTDEYGLHEAPRIDSYEGLVFASLAEEGPSLEEHLGDFTWYLDTHLKLSPGGMEVIGEPHRWEADINWKVGADNFSGDSYHTQITHQSAIKSDLGQHDAAAVAFGPAENKGGFHVTQCDGHATSFGVFDERDFFWGYPDEVTQHFSADRLTEEQYDIARHSIFTTGNIFPNLSLIHIGSALHEESEYNTYLSFRQWIPRGPNRMEISSWNLAPKEASDEYKEKAHKAAVASFSPSGSFEQDDMGVWAGITDSSGSRFARKNNTNFNYQMGWEAGAGSIDTDFPGPGTVLDTNLEDGVSRTFHCSWYEAMSGKSAPREYPETKLSQSEEE